MAFSLKNRLCRSSDACHGPFRETRNRFDIQGLPNYKPVSVPRPSVAGSGNGAGPLLLPYLVLLRMGFALPARITAAAVRSYRTFSPLPAKVAPGGRYCFLWHFP